MSVRNPPPPEFIRSLDLYHGAMSQAGLDIPSLIIRDKKLVPAAIPSKYRKRSFMRPLENRVYVTPDIRYATIYALGGDYSDSHSSAPDKTGPWAMRENTSDGYIFVCDGKDLSDIEPDEDVVGEVGSDLLRRWIARRFTGLGENNWIGETTKRLITTIPEQVVTRITYAASEGTETTKKRAMDGLALWQTKLGKQMIKRMSDAEKIALISAGAHIANDGPLPVREGWKISNNSLHLLRSDCLNFFEIATRVL